MSSLIFHTREDEAAVSGMELRKFATLLNDLAWRAIERDLDVHELAGPSLLRRAVTLPDWCERAQGTAFAREVKLLCTGAGRLDEPVNLPGRDNVAGILEVHLNTVVANNSDPVALAVRLAAQCACNAWIDGADRKWLADLIEQGARTTFPGEIAADAPAYANRPLFDGGWTSVVELLRAGDGIVVLASSVTEGFPGQIWAGREGELRDEFRRWWQQATPEQRWDRSEIGLREETELTTPVLRIAPNTLHTRAFGRDRGVNPTWYRVAAAWRSV